MAAEGTRATKGAKKSTAKPPGAKRSTAKPPGAKKSTAKPPGAKRSTAKPPGAKRSTAKSPGPRKPMVRSPGSAERLRQRRSLRQEAILRAAGAELLDSGYSGASLDRIAASVFVSKATLYHYFATKPDLYLAWLQMVHAAAKEQIEPIATSDTPPRDRLRAMVVAEVALLTDEFPDYTRVFMRGMDWPDELRDVIHEHREEHEHLFQSVIAEGIEQGAFRVPDPTVARHCVQGCLAYIPEWYRADGRIRPAELGEAMATTLLQLLRADAGPGR